MPLSAANQAAGTKSILETVPCGKSTHEETVEIVVEADFDELPQERRRFALINIPRSLFSQATAEIAKRNRLR